MVTALKAKDQINLEIKVKGLRNAFLQFPQKLGITDVNLMMIKYWAELKVRKQLKVKVVKAIKEIIKME